MKLFEYWRNYAKIVLQSGGHLEYTILRSYVKISIQKMFRVLNIDVLLIKVSITDGRRRILHHIGILSFFHSGYLEIHPKWRVGSKISSVNILIYN